MRKFFKIWAWILCVCMVMSNFTISVYATEAERNVQNEIPTESEVTKVESEIWEEDTVGAPDPFENEQATMDDTSMEERIVSEENVGETELEFEVIVDSGSCGTNAEWILYQDGTLTITGEGAMDDYDYYSPWYEEHRNAIKKVEIGEGITYIGAWSFYSHYSLESVSISSTVKTIGNGAFYGSNKLCAINDYETGLLRVPDTVERINNSFGYTGFTNVYLGGQLQAVGTASFTGLKIGTFTVANDIGAFEQQQYGNASSANQFTYETLYIGKDVTAKWWVNKYIARDMESDKVLFSFWTGILENYVKKEIIVDSQNAEILAVDGAVYCKNDNGYTLFDMPEVFTFKGFPENIVVTKIEGGALFKNTVSGKIEIPNTVTEIGQDAFKNCDHITEVVLPSGLKVLGETAFAFCDKLTKVNIPKSLEDNGINDYDECFKDTPLSDITWEDGITRIPSGLFYGCLLSGITIPNTVTVLEDQVFRDCVNLTSIEIPEGVEEIGYDCFRDSGLKTIVLPTTIKRCRDIFDGCELDTLTIKNKNWFEFIIDSETDFKATKKIYGYKNSYANELAFKYEIPFYDIESGTQIAQPDYVICYELNGGINHPNNPVGYNEGQTVVLLDATKEGARFEGWFSADNIKMTSISGQSITVYAKWIEESKEELKSISLDKENLTLYVGDTAQITVIYEPENAVVESEAEWTSDNTDVATVEKGMITAVGVGTATITATVDGKQASCIVTVNPETVEIEDIVLTPAEVDLYVGQTKTITVSILPEGLQPNESIQWLDYDENTISVKAKNSESLAEVKGLKAGTTQIKVRVDGIEKTVVVTVLPCTIRLDYRDGSEIRSIDAVYGEPISNLPSNPEREGYIFAGWYTKENGEGELVTADTILIDQWILYAHWISVNEGMWATPIGDQIYTGKAIKPTVEVYDGDTLLVQGQDYTVSYKNNTNVADKYAAKAPTVIVKGKGQYQSSATVTFNIVPKSIEDMDVTAESVYKIVSSKVQKPTPAVKWANKSFKKGKDFTVSYPETQSGAYKEPGRYEIVIKGTGNYTGERSVWLVLSEKERTPISKASVKKIADVQWEGYEICPKPVVTYKKATLEEGIDYELEYENNIEVGTATIKMIGIGSYSGMKKVTFKIKGVSISKASVNGLGPVTYNGEDQEPLTTLWIDGEELYEYNDYTVTYKNNRNVGTAQVIFTGKGKYTGTLKKTFKINQYDFSAHSLDYIDSECFYSKGGSKPIVSLWVNGENLVEGKDYKISYKNNKAVNDGSNPDKQPMVILKGKGNFKGTITETFVIEAKYIDDVSINVQDVVTPTKKNKWKSIPVLTDTDGKKLVAGKDYDKNIVYTYAEEAIMQDGSIREAGTEVDKNDIPSVGTFLDVTINGINNYHGTAIVTYMVVPASIAKAKTSVPNQIYTGQEITLEESDITVKVGGQKLSTDDFEIVPDSYVNNVKKGTASVTIRGTGNYGGTKVVKFKIVPKSIIWWK